MAELRPARHEDVGAILELQRAFYAHGGYRFEEGIAREGLEGLLNDASFGRV
jgi:hypothetical protein